MPPYQGGGEMIGHVSFKRTTFNELPFKFEAGTPNYPDVIAFAKALNLYIPCNKHSFTTNPLIFITSLLISSK